MRRVLGPLTGISSSLPIGLAPPSTVETVPGAPSSQKRVNGIGRWSPAVMSGQASKAARTCGASMAS